MDLLEGYCNNLANIHLAKDCGLIEAQFIEDLTKYVETIGELVFNCKQIEGVPKTNNLHESFFKQLNHFLRKINGFCTTIYYILSHGEYIMFVDPQEKFEEILETFKNLNHKKVREQIHS